MARRIGNWIFAMVCMAPVGGCAHGNRIASTAVREVTPGPEAADPRTVERHSATETPAPPLAIPETTTIASRPTVVPELPARTMEAEKPSPVTPPSPVPPPANLTPAILPTAASAGPQAPAKPPEPPLAPVSDLPSMQSVPNILPAPKTDLPRLEPLVEALQCVIDNHPNKALQLLRKYDQATQEVFLALMPVLALMTQKGFEQLAPAEVAVLGDQMQSLAQLLRPHSKLAIDKACYCEWIKSYGIYKPLPEGHAFLGSTPGRPGELVQLYVELRNFASEANNGAYATRLSSSVEIRNQKGEQVWLYRFDDGKQPIRSRTLLHDYFNNYCFYVPSNLPAGTYALTIHVQDETRPEKPRVASKTLEFRVTSMSARVP